MKHGRVRDRHSQRANEMDHDLQLMKRGGDYGVHFMAPHVLKDNSLRSPWRLRVFLLDAQSTPRPPREGTAKWTKVVAAQFDSLLSGAMHPGCMGQSVRLDEQHHISVDWLSLGQSDCFATFTAPSSATADYLLLLSRRDELTDRRQLAWFVERILKPIGLVAPEEQLRGIRLCPHPSVLIASCAPPLPRQEALLETAETAFAEAFFRATNHTPTN